MNAGDGVGLLPRKGSLRDCQPTSPLIWPATRIGGLVLERAVDIELQVIAEQPVRFGRGSAGVPSEVEGPLCSDETFQ